MGPFLLRALRFFVSASLVLGGVLLLAEARVLRELPVGWEYVALSSGLWAAGMVVAVVSAVRLRWPWQAPAAAIIASLMAGVAWAHFDPTGHRVLSAFAPAVAVLTGVGIFLRHRWAWPVAFAISAGIGPLFLSFASLSSEAYAAAFALFLAISLALLALARSFLESSVDE